MLGFIFKRVLLLIPIFIGLTLSTFTLVRMVPGDIVQVLMGERMVDPELHAAAMKRLGLDQPLPIQYLDYLKKIFTGDFGNSFRDRSPVLNDFFSHFVPTLELAVCAIIIASVLGIALGIIAALKRGTWLDYTLMSASLAGYSMPIYLLGPILTGIFCPLFGFIARVWRHQRDEILGCTTVLRLLAARCHEKRPRRRIVGCD